MDLLLREVPYDDPAVTLLIEAVQEEYVVRYGSRDAGPVEPGEFAPPHGAFLVAEVDGVPVGCAGLRRLDGDTVEVKRMFIRTPFRRKGYARQLLTALEERARLGGFRRAILETGLPQPEALALYPSAGYEPVAPFGHYRDDPMSRCFGKDL
ncbi:MAG TPA: GNAT family N-acetyltransferase [Actinomycetales bacterium]|nr:GNAT family N-acetyltransferase [Actinomycetales bacterium]